MLGGFAAKQKSLSAVNQERLGVLNRCALFKELEPFLEKLGATLPSWITKEAIRGSAPSAGAIRYWKNAVEQKNAMKPIGTSEEKKDPDNSIPKKEEAKEGLDELSGPIESM